MTGWGKVTEAVLATRRALPYLLGGLGTGLLSMVLLPPLLFVGILSWAGVTLPVLPSAVRLLRRRAGSERRRIADATGLGVPESYLPLDGPLLIQARTVVRDRSTLRDLRWLAAHAVVAPVFGLLTIGLPLATLGTVAVPFYWWALPVDDPASTLFPVTSWATALASPLVGVLYTAVWLALVPRMFAWRTTLARRLLTPPATDLLTERVAELTASRAAALEAHGSELRRIERDLHDGTQNKLVAVAMHLGIVERALRRDPGSALPLVLRAQNAAEDALAGLRGVVRSIYPPILAERGLDSAAAALVAECSVPCTLQVGQVARAPAAVESAAYFVIAETLTNIAKHSGAEHASVRLDRRTNSESGVDSLVIDVTDDGAGGVDETAGTGLAGIRRRVMAFDGVFGISSPAGGPTAIHVELPCGS